MTKEETLAEEQARIDKIVKEEQRITKRRREKKSSYPLDTNERL